MRDLQAERQRQSSVGSSVRLLVDTPDGLLTTYGQLVELSEGGISVHLRRSMKMQHAGRVSLTLGGKSCWLPIVTRWAREDAAGWTVGCEFDRPTPEKQAAIREHLRC